jgi:uncharacterized protein YacL
MIWLFLKNSVTLNPTTNFTEGHKMLKDPVKRVGFIVMLLNLLLIGLVLANIFDNQKNPMFMFSIVFLQCSMVMVYTAFKHQQKRIDALEAKLNEQQRQD